MIDLHAHILPGLDDGSQDWNETLAMCSIAMADGIHTIAATPHIKPGFYSPGKALIFEKVAELNQLLLPAPSPTPLAQSIEHGAKRCPPLPALSPMPPALTILSGADNSFQPDILKQIEEGTAVYLADPTNLSREMPGIFHRDPINAINATNATNPINQTHAIRYILLELSDYFLFPQVKDCIRKLREKNIVPILSHPERIAMIQKNYKLLRELIQAGALSQVTAMSITGEFGKNIKKFTKTLLLKNLVHVIASDAHSKDRRPPILSRAVAEAATIIGQDQAEMMVRKIPQAIIEGKEVGIT